MLQRRKSGCSIAALSLCWLAIVVGGVVELELTSADTCKHTDGFASRVARRNVGESEKLVHNREEIHID